MIRLYIQKLFYLFPILFCFCLPFGTIYISPLIFFWVLFSFFNIERSILVEGFKNPKFLAFILFFILTALSAAFSNNTTESLFSLEVKMTFVVFPYLLFCFKWPLEILKRCIMSFVSGCFFACVILLLRSFSFFLEGHPEYFFYSLFSNFMHASYFAMYLILASVLILVFYNDWFKAQKGIIYSSYFFLIVFIVSIFLCSSKLGLISFIICLPITLFYKFKNSFSKKRKLMVLSGFIIILLLAIVMLPGLFSRFNSVINLSINDIDKSSIESTKVRVLIWNEAIQLIKSNFIFGTGVGDANDSLYQAYLDNGLTGAFEHKFNAHNQFFQTFIGMGLIGFLALFYLTFGKIVSALRSNNFMLFIFSLLVTLNFMVESMLQTVAGVLFFAFFACFFNLISETELKRKSDRTQS